jgi:hypothetical protein
MNKIRIIKVSYGQIGDVDLFADFFIKMVDLSDWYDTRVGVYAYNQL